MSEVEAEAEESQQNVLLKLAFDHSKQYFLDESDQEKVMAHIVAHGIKKVVSLDSSEYRNWLLGKYYRKYNKVISGSQYRDILVAITATVKYSGMEPETRRLWLRTAKHNGAFWYDLGEGSVIKITPNKCQKMGEPEPIFKHTQHQRPQEVVFNSENKFDELLELTNSQNRLLYKVTVIASFIPDIPHPIIVFLGEQGSGKTTQAKHMQEIVDPRRPVNETLRSDPREVPRTLSQSHVISYDNVSDINDIMADYLCKAVTGGGNSNRKLYTDEDAVIQEYKPVLTITAISLPTTRPDFLERCLILRNKPLNKRLSEEEINTIFTRFKPDVVGECLTAVSRALLIYDEVKEEFADQKITLPRMADYVLWAESIARVLGYKPMEFFNEYKATLEQYDFDVVEAYPEIPLIMNYVNSHGKTTLTPTEWLSTIKSMVEDKSGLPKTPSVLSKHIREVEPALRRLGYVVQWDRSSIRRQLTIFSHPPKSANLLSSLSQPSSNDANDDNDGIFAGFAELFGEQESE